MVVLSSSMSAKVSKMSCHEYKGYKWQCQHSHPHNNTVSRNEKFWVDQVTPPPGKDKGGGTNILGCTLYMPRVYPANTCSPLCSLGIRWMDFSSVPFKSVCLELHCAICLPQLGALDSTKVGPLYLHSW